MTCAWRSIAARRKNRVVGFDAVRYGHRTVVFVEIEPAVRHVISESPGHIAKPDGKVVVGATKKKSCADCWFSLAGLMAGEGVAAHVVGSACRVPERLGWKFPRRVFSPRTIAARLATIGSMAPLNRNDLVLFSRLAHTGNDWGAVRFSDAFVHINPYWRRSKNTLWRPCPTRQ